MIGRAIRVPELFELASRIERRYREDGIPVVATVPTQDFADGDARIVVFDQSYIATVAIRGDSPGLRARLDPYIRRLVEMRPLRIDRVERILLRLSDLAGMNIQANLIRPEPPTTGSGLTPELPKTKQVV